jgi:hypothetical protein
MRNETWVWSALGGPFEWKLALGAVPDRHEYEFLEATLLLALETIKRGMEKHEERSHAKLDNDAKRDIGSKA